MRTLPERTLIWRDVNSWPAGWPRVRLEPGDPQLQEYAATLRQTYDAIRCYHGCRPESTHSYTEYGLRPLSRDEKHKYLSRFFRRSELPSLEYHELHVVLDELALRDNGSVFAALDGEHLLKNASHYMIYGSEQVLVVAIELTDRTGQDFRTPLRSIGTPTLFTVDVPTDLMSNSDLAALSLYLSNEGADSATPGIIDFTFLIRETVTPERIREHYHPTELYDWHEGRPYRYSPSARDRR